MSVIDYFRKKDPVYTEEEKVQKVSLTQKYLDMQRSSSIPSAVSKTITTNFLVAAALLVLCATAAIVLKQTAYLAGFVFSAYLAWVGTTTLVDYKNGQIHERVLICTVVNKRLKSSQIIMQDVSVEPAHLYEFYYTRTGCPFYPDCVYIVYTNENQPHRIVAWVSV
ncbi:MAG: hypothetical protein II038_02275 [Lachnospiraceae bacterium]|nr:hypothetical protein [Lachnospiraceae bacterium]